MFVAQGRASWAAVAHGLALQARARRRRPARRPGRRARRLGRRAGRLGPRPRGEAVPADGAQGAGRDAPAGRRGGLGRPAPSRRRRAGRRPHPARRHRRPAGREPRRPGRRPPIDQPGPAHRHGERRPGSARSRRAPTPPPTATTWSSSGPGWRSAIGDPRELLARIEATRVLASRMPSARPPDDPEMADPARRAAQPRPDRCRRRQHRSSSGTAPRSSASASSVRCAVARGPLRGDGAVVDLNGEITAAIELLGDRQLVAHAALDGRLHAVSVQSGRAALHDLGGLDGVRERGRGGGLRAQPAQPQPGVGGVAAGRGRDALRPVGRAGPAAPAAGRGGLVRPRRRRADGGAARRAVGPAAPVGRSGRLGERVGHRMGARPPVAASSGTCPPADRRVGSSPGPVSSSPSSR